MLGEAHHLRKAWATGLMPFAIGNFRESNAAVVIQTISRPVISLTCFVLRDSEGCSLRFFHELTVLL